MPDTRTEAIWRAIAQELARRRGILDSDHGLMKMTITVRMQSGSNEVRGLTVSEDRSFSKKRDS